MKPVPTPLYVFCCLSGRTAPCRASSSSPSSPPLHQQAPRPPLSPCPASFPEQSSCPLPWTLRLTRTLPPGLREFREPNQKRYQLAGAPDRLDPRQPYAYVWAAQLRQACRADRRELLCRYCCRCQSTRRLNVLRLMDRLLKRLVPDQSSLCRQSVRPVRQLQARLRQWTGVSEHRYRSRPLRTDLKTCTVEQIGERIRHRFLR